jgi:CheY-like chemotaxis protein
MTSPDTVLIIDDEPRTRQAIAKIVAGMGYAALEAPDGKEALRLHALNKEAIVAVTLNLVMSGMNGRETLEAFSREAPFLPIVISSGLEPAAVQLSGRVPGSPGVVYLGKPYETRQLQEALQRVIGEMKRSGGAPR